MYRRRRDTQAEEVPESGELVLMHRETGRLLALNPTAAAVWDLLDGRRDAAAMAAVIADATGAPLERVTADVAALLVELEREGFLEPAGSEGTGPA